MEIVQRELKEAFRLYDKEGKGYLTLEVLRDILRELDDKITEDDLDMMIDEIDADGSGTVDFDGTYHIFSNILNSFHLSFIDSFLFAILSEFMEVMTG